MLKIKRKIQSTLQFLSFLVLLQINAGCANTTNEDKNASSTGVDLYMAKLTINTHPPDAVIYEQGKYFDRSPITVAWTTSQVLNYEYFKKDRKILSKEFVVVKDGYLPIKKQYELELNPPGEMAYEFHDLIILEHDPNAPVTSYNAPSSSDTKHITIKQEESTLDKLLKAGQFGLILQSLKPRR